MLVRERTNPERGPTLNFSRRQKTAYTLAALVTFAVAAEGGVRLVCWAVGRVPYTAATPWCVADDDLLYALKPHFEGKVYQATARINNLGMRGEDIAVSKAAGTSRVLCLGDSRTFGFVVRDDECYPARLQPLLRERHPSHRVEVLNAGTHGYSSYQGLRYLEVRGARLQPDVVTVAFGANERRFVLKPEQADGPEWFHPAARSLRWRTRVSWSYAMLGAMKLLSHARGEDTWRKDVLALPSQRLDDLSCRVSLGAYRANLSRLARWCRERKIGLVFFIMEDAPPIERAFEEGRRLRREKRYDEAIAAFSRVGRESADPLTGPWFKALVLDELGLTREAQGRRDEAQAAFRESAQAAAVWSVMGGTAIRQAREYNEVARVVAREFRVPTVDIASQFLQRPELFADYCHYTAEGHRLIAEALADCLDRNDLSGPLPKRSERMEVGGRRE